MTPSAELNGPRPPAHPALPTVPHTDLTGDLRAVVGSLHEQYDPQLGAETVEAEIQDVADQFEGAWVRAFVPLFVRRFSRERLRGRDRHPHVPAAGSAAAPDGSTSVDGRP